MLLESRSLQDLLPCVSSRAISFIAQAETEIEGLKILVTCTLRSKERQAQLYAIGRRGRPGERVVTNCSGEEGNESYHEYKVAFDILPMLFGKPVWNSPDGDEVSDPIWQKIGEIGERHGLEWAGRWKRFPEGPHFQYLGGLNLVQLRAGSVPT